MIVKRNIDFVSDATGVLACVGWRIDGTPVGLTARHALAGACGNLFMSLSGVLDSNALIGEIALRNPIAHVDRENSHFAETKDSASVFGELVYRIGLNGRWPGVVIGIGLALRLTSGSRQEELIVSGLLAVDFQRNDTGDRHQDGRSEETPDLNVDDAGAIITTPDDEIIGIVVAKAGMIAYAAPVQTYAEVNGLRIGFLTHDVAHSRLSIPAAKSAAQNVMVDALRSQGPDIDIQFSGTVA